MLRKAIMSILNRTSRNVAATARDTDPAPRHKRMRTRKADALTREDVDSMLDGATDALIVATFRLLNSDRR